MREGGRSQYTTACEVEELIKQGKTLAEACAKVAKSRNLLPDSVRRSYQLWLKQGKNGGKIDSIPKDLDLKRIGEERDYWRRRAGAYQKELLEQEGFLKAVASLVPQIPLTKPPKVDRNKKKSDLQLVCLLSDHHIGRTISRTEMEGLNEFDFDIWASRWWECVRKIITFKEIFDPQHNIETCWLCFLGDMMNDEHREENLATNQFKNVRGILKGGSVIAQGIQVLLSHFKRVDATGIIGNEPRLDLKRTAKHQYNNFDFLLYQVVRMLLAAETQKKRFTFLIPLSSEIVVQRQGWKILLSHGHEVRSWAGIPYYGIDRRRAREQDMRRPQGGFDFWFFGHFHTPSDLRGKDYGNGSLCGGDEYAKSGLAAYSRPSQKLLALTLKHGITYQMNLWLDQAKSHPFIFDSGREPKGGIEDEDITKELSEFSKRRTK